MKRALVLMLVLLTPAAFAAGKKKKKRKQPQLAQVVHPFADVPVAKLQVVDTRSGQGVVQSKEGDGDVVLVHAGDLLGQEALTVEKVTRGCLVLKGADATEISLCADVPEVPST